MQKKIGPILVDICQADITKLHVDAVVNAANNEWLMGGGVAGAIKRAGGSIIEEEAREQGVQPVGACVVTSAGKLPAKHVIHAAVMAMDFKTNGDIIRRAIQNTFKAAEEKGIKSMALPAFGTGVGGFPFDQCADIMLNEIFRFAPKSKSLKKIIFALFGQNALEAFEKKLETLN